MVFSLGVTEINGGALRWFIQDPTGQSRWSGREERTGEFTSGAMPVRGGEWTINVLSEADTATYWIWWQSLPYEAPAPGEFENPCYHPG